MGGMSGQLKLVLSVSLCLLVALAGWSWCLVASGSVPGFRGVVPFPFLVQWRRPKNRAVTLADDLDIIPLKFFSSSPLVTA